MMEPITNNHKKSIASALNSLRYLGFFSFLSISFRVTMFYITKLCHKKPIFTRTRIKDNIELCLEIKYQLQ